MSQLGSPFSGLASGRKLTDADLTTAIRFMVAAESEATRLFARLAESTDNKLAVEVLAEMADEQLARVGTFLRLLRVLAPSDERSRTEAVTGAAGPLGTPRLTTGPAGVVVPAM
jgi:rubrerythrin